MIGLTPTKSGLPRAKQSAPKMARLSGPNTTWRWQNYESQAGRGTYRNTGLCGKKTSDDGGWILRQKARLMRSKHMAHDDKYSHAGIRKQLGLPDRTGAQGI